MPLNQGLIGKEYPGVTYEVGENEVLGVVALIDPAKTSRDYEIFTLEYGTVVLASEGYPAAPRTGDVIEGLDAAAKALAATGELDAVHPQAVLVLLHLRLLGILQIAHVLRSGEVTYLIDCSSGSSFCATHFSMLTSPGRQTITGPGFSSMV